MPSRVVFSLASFIDADCDKLISEVELKLKALPSLLKRERERVTDEVTESASSLVLTNPQSSDAPIQSPSSCERPCLEPECH